MLDPTQKEEPEYSKDPNSPEVPSLSELHSPAPKFSPIPEDPIPKDRSRLVTPLVAALLVAILAIVVLSVNLWSATNNYHLVSDKLTTQNSEYKAVKASIPDLKDTAYEEGFQEGIEIGKNYPKNGQIIQDTSLSKLAPLTVENDDQHSYFLKLISVDNDETLLSFFVEAGKTAEIKVPLKTCKVYYAYGDTWHNASDLFGSNTQYGKYDDLFYFYADRSAYHGYSLTTYTVEDENISFDELSAKEFAENKE
jgi:hypothetical protein